ncbi:MAG: chorismate mutase [Bauldia sp.]|nr:chorismate mutase [Bauldia sp.]
MAANGDSDARTLAELRAKIDGIDEAMHRLLIERGTVIEALIAAKGTARTGAAFRPQREAEMMRRLAERHAGVLPLATAEHLWREIITTFTFLQAPFRVFVDLGDDHAAMHDLARFAFGFSVEMIIADGPADVVRRVAASGLDLGLIPQRGDGTAWWRDLSDAGPRIMALLPFIAQEGRIAGAPALVVSPRLADPSPADLRVVAASAGISPPRLEPSVAIVAEDGAGEFLVAAEPDVTDAELVAMGLHDVERVGGIARGITIDGAAGILRAPLARRVSA